MAQLDFEINSTSWQLLLVTNLLFQDEQSKATLAAGWGFFPSLKSATATDELEQAGVFTRGENCGVLLLAMGSIEGL